MSRRFTLSARAAAAVAAAAVAVPLVAGSATAKKAHDTASGTRGPVSHVLLISVDGLHQSDLRWYVRTHPDSELAGWSTAARSTAGPRRSSRPIPTRA